MKLITNNFRTHSAKQFVESWTETEKTSYYVGAHKSLRYINDSVVPDPGTELEATYYDLYDELLFGKRVISTDVAHMVRNIPWVSGTVYEMYDSRSTELETKDFFVVSPEAGSYHVFKCLNNNGGVPSTDQPLRSEIEPEDDFYKKPDGYEWKYMYSITASQYTKFATGDFVPVFPVANVTANAISGSIDTIIIEDNGSLYKSYITGTIKETAVAGNNLIFSLESDTATLSANSAFYENNSLYIDSGAGDGELRTIIDYFTSGGERRVLIDRPFDTLPTRSSAFIIAPRVIISGDGQNCTARCEIDMFDGSVSEIIIITRGSGYTYADIEVVGNTGITSATATSSAVVRPVISPPNGHGSDVINELFANKVGIGIIFTGSESGAIPATNDFRKISLIKDPKFKMADFELATTSEVFTAGEKVTQISTGAFGTVSGRNSNTMTISAISGFFVTSTGGNANTALLGNTSASLAYIDSIDRSFNTFDQRDIYQTSIVSTGLPAYNGFTADEVVVQAGLNQIETQIVKLTLANSAYTFVNGETITQANTGAQGIVINRYTTVLTITNVVGYFSVGETITGNTSATPVEVTDYDNTFGATATGNIHTVTLGANNTATIALTMQNGEFLISDDETNTINTFSGQTSQAIADLTGKDELKNKLVDGSGEFLYVENMLPITRNASQNERIKLIIEF